MFRALVTTHIRNPNTRLAYLAAVRRFAAWCERRGVTLDRIEPVVVATHVEELSRTLSPANVKQHFAALRLLFDCLVAGQVLAFNPAGSVRGPRHVGKSGKTPVLSAQETRALLDGIDVSTLVGLRDRAFLGVLVYSFARVGASVSLRVADYCCQWQAKFAQFWIATNERFTVATNIIPTVIDQNPCAHLRMPRDMIFHGWSMRLFQAWQHSATMSS